MSYRSFGDFILFLQTNICFPPCIELTEAKFIKDLGEIEMD